MLSSTGSNLAKSGYSTVVGGSQQAFAAEATLTLVQIKQELELLHFELVTDSASFYITFAGYDESGNAQEFSLQTSPTTSASNNTIANLNTTPTDILKVSRYDSTNNIYKLTLANPLYFSNGVYIGVQNGNSTTQHASWSYAVSTKAGA